MRKKLSIETVGKWVDAVAPVCNEIGEYDSISYITIDELRKARTSLERLLGELLVSERREKKNTSNSIYQV